MSDEKPSPVRNVRITVEYDGTCYAGWQVQKGKTTIQGELGRAVREITGERTTIYGAGRTDAGVHAKGQVAHFHTSSRMPCERMVHAINAHLPPDIAVIDVCDAPPDFHSQYSATGKVYTYTILNRDVKSALKRNFAVLVKSPLDVNLMRQAAVHIEGRHDFRAFCTESRLKKNTVRTLRSLQISVRDDEIVFTVSGDGFLYNMVRTIVGTLMLVGRGLLAPDDVARIVASCDRRKAGPNAPAKGLCLVRVEY
jgi:tRNA pseudouridine38-40 synthase